MHECDISLGQESHDRAVRKLPLRLTFALKSEAPPERPESFRQSRFVSGSLCSRAPLTWFALSFSSPPEPDNELCHEG